MKLDKTFWISTGVTLATVLVALFAYDMIKTKMASKSVASTMTIEDSSEEEEA